tara:strand:+ start:264 stop:464 length:201 start_codon:yes stop_codon:yes gene_type:complete
MIEVLIVSIGLVLVIEGLLYFVIADKLDLLVTFLKNYDNQKIKKISLCVALFGLCLIYFTFRFYRS